jgi:anti-sigma factor RsiW
VQWVSDRLRQPVKVPDLSTSGYRLMGGRVVATSHGPAAMFMYDDDHGERLVMLTRPMAANQNAPMLPQSSGDVAGFAWADDGIGYSLVGHGNADTLRPIANEVHRQARSIRGESKTIAKILRRPSDSEKATCSAIDIDSSESCCDEK